MKYVHPFPARMAPELASKEMASLPVGSKVLDPMCGSGTTLRHAIDGGHMAVGWDIDPLAVKMARTWCRRFDVGRLTKQAADLKKMLESETGNRPSRFSDCQETQNFVDFWFAKEQKNDLNRLSLAIEDAFPLGRTRDFFQIAMSRIVITKFRGASLAWDVSHSRPHKMKRVNDFETIPEFFISVEHLTHMMENNPSKRDARVRLGDCRKIMTREKFDAIIDLPPLTRPRATLDTGPFAVHSGEPAPGLGFLGIWPLVRVAGRPRHCEAVAGCTPASTSPPAPGPLSGSRSSPRSGAHPSASR